MPVELQVMSILAANEGFLDALDVKDVLPYEAALHQHIGANHPDFLTTIREKGSLNDEQSGQLKKVMSDFTKLFVEERRGGGSSGAGGKGSGSSPAKSGGGENRASA